MTMKGYTIGATLTALALLCLGIWIAVTLSVVNAEPEDYDSNGNGILEKSEVIAVVIDYFRDEITKDEVLEILVLYFPSDATPEPTPTPPPTPTPISTPTPHTSGLRPLSEWTAEEPATFEEIEAELEHYRGSHLDVASWGGAYQAAQRQAYFWPFQEKFNIQIVEDSPIDYAKITSMVRTGNVTWDVIDSGVRAIHQRGMTGDFEELSPAIHNRYLPHIPQVTVTPLGGGGGIYWSTGLAYRKDKIDTLWDGRRPEDWTAFWDTRAFPGTRWMGTRVSENLFFAHFASTPEILDTAEGRSAFRSLTPDQIDLSFEKLEEIKPYVEHWWTVGTDCPGGLLYDEVDMCTAWNGRIWNDQDEPGGENLHFCFECGHLLQSDAFYIPKGSLNKTLAELFISWTAEPAVNARMVDYVPYVPINQQAIPLVSNHLVRKYGTSHPTSPAALERSVIVDEVWLGANFDALTERMKKFLSDS